MQSVPEEAIQDWAGCSGRVCGADLPEDLSLPRNHRVEACGNAEQVKGGGLVAEPIQRGAELGLESEQCRFGLPLGVVGGLGGQVELGAVARRQANGLGVVARKPARKLPGAFWIEGCALPQLDRGLVMRDADENDAHQPK